MRLGDLDALTEKLKNGLENAKNAGKENYAKIFEVFIDWVSREPTIDLVPVVRCRECTHYKICDEWKNGKRMLCEIHHHSYLDHDGDNHFCSWGHRKIETVLPKSDTKDESLEANHDKHPSDPV